MNKLSVHLFVSKSIHLFIYFEFSLARGLLHYAKEAG